MTSRIKFLISLGNLIKNGAVKTVKQAMDFAEQQFGKIDKSFTDDIINVFKKEGKTKKGDVVPINKQGGIVRRPEEFATRKEYEKYLDETLGPSDDVFGSPLKDDLLKEWDKVNAKNVTPDIKKVIDEKEGDDFIDFIRKQGDEEGANKIQKEVDRLNKAIEDADKRVAAKEALKKRTDDIASGDPTGEVSEGIESLGTSVKKIKKAADEMKELSKKTTPESIFKDFVQGQSKMRDLRRQGQVRTAVRWFMRQEEEAGRLKLRENDSKALREYSQTEEGDPINIFRRYYGENALEAADDVADVFNQGETFDHYGQLLRQNVDSKILTPKTKGLGEYDPNVLTPKQEDELRRQLLKEQEQKKMLEDWDPTDRTKNAEGGLIDILKL